MPDGSDKAKERKERVKGKRERERDTTLVSEQQSEQSGEQKQFNRVPPRNEG